ncbi:MAG: hypothetical protein RIQ46_1707, partial [Pseudomonadota bacterium]
RRGISGGYFGTRPDIGVIERTVSAHLEALNIDGRDATVLASALWVEVVRKAALADRGQVHAMTEAMKRRVQAMPESASYVMVRDLELLSQAEMFRVTNSTYIKLIFDINVEFSRRRFPDSPIEDDESPEHRAFVKLWREAKIQELNAVALGDADLAAIAAQYSRKVWYRRIGRRFGMSLFG